MNIAGKIFSVVLTVGALGCAHTTSIKAEPAGTKIFVDGEYLGQDRVSTSIGNSFLGSYTVRAVNPELPPLEVVVDQPHLDWGVALAAAGGCLGVGCGCGICAFLSSVTVLQFAPEIVFMVGPVVIPILAAVVTGGPFLTLLGWSTHGPDALSLDLKKRQVDAIPTTKVTIVEVDEPVATRPAPQPSSRPSSAAPPAEPPAQPEAPVTSPAQPKPEDKIKPFEY
ncbi:MAG: hypothetical protein ABIJ09_21915 [Pseudomonadota bacterium]